LQKNRHKGFDTPEAQTYKPPLSAGRGPTNLAALKCETVKFAATQRDDLTGFWTIEYDNGRDAWAACLLDLGLLFWVWMVRFKVV
jgi:hypothetical protein